MGCFGDFDGSDLRTGVFAISGDNTDYTACSFCAVIYADNGSDGKPAALYVADSGSVTVTSVTGTIAGSVSNLTFQNVTIGNDGTQMAADSCVSAITSANFSAPLTQGTAANVVGRQHISLNFPGAALRHRHH